MQHITKRRGISPNGIKRFPSPRRKVQRFATVYNALKRSTTPRNGLKRFATLRMAHR